MRSKRGGWEPISLLPLTRSREKAPLVGGAFALGLIRFVLLRRRWSPRRAGAALWASSLTVAVGLEELGFDLLSELLVAEFEEGGYPLIDLLEVRHTYVLLWLPRFD